MAAIQNMITQTVSAAVKAVNNAMENPCLPAGAGGPAGPAGPTGPAGLAGASDANDLPGNGGHSCDGSVTVPKKTNGCRGITSSTI
jgi:hypothetical protein